MTGKRRRCSAEFRATVALEALKGDLTAAGPVARRGTRQTLIETWKRQAVEGMSTVFSGRAEAAAADREAEPGRLHAETGELVVERDFLRKGAPAKAPPVRARRRADDERVAEARDDRSGSPAALDRPAAPAARDQPVDASRARRGARAR